MFSLLAAIMLLSAVWLGLAFTNRLVGPIRRLIAATDQVSAGNFYVQVPVRAAEGDLAHLGETFNKMTSELRLQQNRLVAANHLMDERRVFTEAVLSGVPVGGDRRRRARRRHRAQPFGARPHRPRRRRGGKGDRAGRWPRSCRNSTRCCTRRARGHARMTQKQMQLNRGGRERTYNVRIAPGPLNRGERTFVATLDDMTDLVAAQRTSAWADVARRIAHEIKNPLTPIQLSAERLKRKYGKVITTDKDVFDQCTDTIIRQVDDIKRMVDEFSSFSRMPKAQLAGGRPARLRRAGAVPDARRPSRHRDRRRLSARRPAMLRFDRRLLSQALTNVVKNATEGIAATETMEGRPPKIACQPAL